MSNIYAIESRQGVLLWLGVVDDDGDEADAVQSMMEKAGDPTGQVAYATSVREWNQDLSAELLVYDPRDNWYQPVEQDEHGLTKLVGDPEWFEDVDPHMEREFVQPMRGWGPWRSLWRVADEDGNERLCALTIDPPEQS